MSTGQNAGQTESKPYWSVMIPTFERELLRETLRSVLAVDQGPGRMQIEVVDNCSQRLNVEALVREEGKGRLGFWRNDRNVGPAENWNVCIRRARGEWVHLLHDDDVVYTGFYEAMEAGAKAAPSAGAAFCRAIYIDEASRQTGVQEQERSQAEVYPNLLWRLGSDNAVRCPGIVVQRRVYEQVGNYDSEIGIGFDWDMWIRIAARFPVWYEPQALVGYRDHAESVTTKVWRTGNAIWSAGITMDRWLKQMGGTHAAKQVHGQRRDFYSAHGISRAQTSASRGDLWAMNQQLRAALNCGTSPRSLRAIGDTMRAWDQYVEGVQRAAAAYRSSRSAEARNLLVYARNQLAREWQEFADCELQMIYPGELQKVQQALMYNPIASEAKTAEEERLIAAALDGLKKGGERWMGDLLIAMLYVAPENLPATVRLDRVALWLLGDYLAYAWTRAGFGNTGVDEAVYRNLVGRLRAEVEERLVSANAAGYWRQAADYMNRTKPAV